MQLSRDQVNTILKNAPAGADKVKILDSLVARGYEIEGANSQTQPVEQKQNIFQRTFSNVKEAVSDPMNVIPQRIADVTPGRFVNVNPDGSVTGNREEAEKAMNVGLSFSPGGLSKSAAGITEPVASLFKGAKQGVSNVVDDIGTSIVNTGDDIANSGIVQTGKEFIERIPRAISRGKESVKEAGLRAERIKNSSPAVQESIKSGLDDILIDAVTTADDFTKKAYRQVVELADETGKKLGNRKQPTSVGGELAAEQFNLINKQQQSVGAKIGAEARKLSKTIKTNMQDAFNQIDNFLSEQGISIQQTKKGSRLNFSGSKYTPAERTKIQQLYDLATEGGNSLSPSQIRDKDQLFSKLKRESNFEGIGDLLVDTKDGVKSLFNVFRDIYSTKLESFSPKMKILNRQYAQLRNLTDDIESSIFKTPNFNITKSQNPAEFAKVNLRRIFGEAASSPVFEGIADAMDAASRGLGYKGATPKQVAEFAQEIRKLFPESTPKTGFSGGIKSGIGGVIDTLSEVGAPNLKDKQEALKKLLQELTGR